MSDRVAAQILSATDHHDMVKRALGLKPDSSVQDLARVLLDHTKVEVLVALRRLCEWEDYADLPPLVNSSRGPPPLGRSEARLGTANVAPPTVKWCPALSYDGTSVQRSLPQMRIHLVQYLSKASKWEQRLLMGVADVKSKSALCTVIATGTSSFLLDLLSHCQPDFGTGSPFQKLGLVSVTRLDLDRDVQKSTPAVAPASTSTPPTWDDVPPPLFCRACRTVGNTCRCPPPQPIPVPAAVPVPEPPCGWCGRHRPHCKCPAPAA
jgi:hypothetical protein